ncbi:MAG: hypothetical protein HPY89_12725 [Pelotomaculum sp.]|nr:hypothetical protein [Pelotomaculum sp.]
MVLNRARRNFWLLARVVTAYIGAVIGAGFASGQEIMQFFVLHGRSGLLGAAVTALLFAYLGGLIMFLSVKMKSASYRDIFAFLLGERAGGIMDALNIFMLLGGLSVMMAGSAAVFEEQFGLPARAGVWAVTVLSSLVVLGGLEGVLAANVFLVPLKFLAVVAVSTAALCASRHLAQSSGTGWQGGGAGGHWLPAAFLYVSYNIVVPLAVLSSLGRMVPPVLGLAGGALGGLLLGMAVSLVTLAGLAYMPEASFCQIPLLYLAGHLGQGFRHLLGLLIWLAILTTAIANAHGFASRLAPEGGSRYRFCGIFACLLALPLSSFSFAGLVRLLYPLFGLAGLVLLAALLFVLPFKSLRKF